MSATTDFLKQLPTFSNIKIGKIDATLSDFIENAYEVVAGVLQLSIQEVTWSNFVQPLLDVDTEIDNYWSVVSHLNAVKNSTALRKVYEGCLEKLEAYSTFVGQNSDLYNRYLALHTSVQFKDFSKQQQKVIADTLRDFKLTGVALEAGEKQQYQNIVKQLSKCCSNFSNNVMDATDSWYFHVSQESAVAGIPDNILSVANKRAVREKKTGWVFGLDYPNFHAISTFAENRGLREEFYKAYVTRASAKPKISEHGKWDNSDNISNILDLRVKKAKLLGFETYADYSLATKMLDNKLKVLNFLNDLVLKTKTIATQEMTDLQQFAEERLDIETLQPWDMSYCSEKLRVSRFSISSREIREYFSLNNVLYELFFILEKLYAISFVKEKVDVWHSDVEFFCIYDEHNNIVGGIYLDLFARPNKRQGAWMDECRVRTIDMYDNLQLPVAYVNCNFAPADESDSALLYHDDVLTLFHEIGHAMHHVLTLVNYAPISGINGVEWDAVEVPSQFMEEFCWQQEILTRMAKHHKTNKVLSEHCMSQLLSSRRFQAGMSILRQIEFALFDFLIHATEQACDYENVQLILDAVRKQISVTPLWKQNKFQNAFTHIFAGGYAAGYFSYKWAEVMSCDIFAAFLDEDGVNFAMGEKFLKCLLSQGATLQFAQYFKQILSRDPNVEALLKRDIY
ncbi:MAG: oligopeptidase A [Thiotrichales bacterium]|nr:MAG: oligopeptidase A [Thiotrichales bacterium]